MDLTKKILTKEEILNLNSNPYNPFTQGKKASEQSQLPEVPKTIYEQVIANLGGIDKSNSYPEPKLGSANNLTKKNNTFYN